MANSSDMYTTQLRKFRAFRSLRVGHVLFAFTQILPKTSMIECFVLSVRVLI